MTASLTLATTHRVLSQLRHDRRTIALIIAVPMVLLGLTAWMFSDTPQVIDNFGPILVGFFPLLVMFIVTSVATLRERTGGTLERLMTMPLGKGDFVVGYALAFALMALIQAVIVVAWAIWVCGMDVAGPLWLLFVVAVLNAVVGSALGLAASALARTEFQAVQLMPAFLLPQILLCGFIMPRDQMPEVLEWISRALPLTYAVDAMQKIATGGGWEDTRGAIGVLVLFIVGAVALGTTTLRRRTE